MTAAAAGGRSRIHDRLMAWGAHHDLRLLGVMWVAFIISYLTPATWLALAMMYLGLGAQLLATVGVINHARHGMCERCIAEWPLNASEIAERRAWVFGLTHRPRYALGVFFAGYGLMVGLPFLLGKPWGSILGWTVWTLSLLTSSYARRWHERLMPWCPYCRRRGWGRGDRVEAPPPPPKAKVDS